MKRKYFTPISIAMAGLAMTFMASALLYAAPVSARDNYELKITIGDRLAVEGFKQYGMPLENEAVQKYINLMGASLALNAGVGDDPLYFVLITSEKYMSFSCPGGIVAITSGLFTLMEDESELANVLAHELAHVKAGHALAAISSISDLKAAGLKEAGSKTADSTATDPAASFDDLIGSLAKTLFEKGLPGKMEFAADVSGMDIAYRTGYDPVGLTRLLNRMKQHAGEKEKPGSWFSTHPRVSERLKRCDQQMKHYPDAGDMAHVVERFQKMKQSVQGQDQDQDQEKSAGQ